MHFTLNGKAVSVPTQPHVTLVRLLRESLGLTGTKVGCEIGECGACTVLMDGKAVDSCLVLAVMAEGRDIVTIEGVGNGDDLHPIQNALIEEGAIQCGYCTPGMVLSLKALLDVNPHPDRREIVESVSGNLCRCTGYAKIIAAVERLAQA